ncbi:MAG: hypothetical protein ACOYJF_09980 [Prevotella sp.]|jgi:hypothetical protein
MEIHIFNPEHEIALASNLKHFTAPHAARQLRRDLGFLPCFWAEEDDFVVVDDVQACESALSRISFPVRGKLIERDGLFRWLRLLASATPVVFRPWGWDLSLRQELLDMGAKSDWMPDDDDMEFFRTVSHRAWASRKLLTPLRSLAGTVGEAEQITNIDGLDACGRRWHSLVVKSPWSSSGRGVKYLRPMPANPEQLDISPSNRGWMQNVIRRQGSLMVEPCYKKILDFGMEFYADNSGEVEFKGLSLFTTEGTSYTGNFVGPEDDKWDRLSQYIDLHLVRQVIVRLSLMLGFEFQKRYVGPLGIDAMVVANPDNPQGPNLLHPCVELNLRRTMGHLALNIAARNPNAHGNLNIGLTDKYRLHFFNSKFKIG